MMTKAIAQKKQPCSKTNGKKAAALMAALAVGTLCAGPAFAGLPVDQSQLSFNQGIPLPDDVPVGQSFTAGVNGRLSEIDLFSNGPNNGGTAVMSIYSGSGFGGTLLGSVTVTFGSTPGTQPIPFDVSGLGINQTAGSVYTFGITSFTGTQQILSDNANPYAGGIQYNNLGFYGSTPTWDLMFATYVPEPSSVALIGLGLVTLAAVRRKP
jgi:hypothetical protein